MASEQTTVKYFQKMDSRNYGIRLSMLARQISEEFHIYNSASVVKQKMAYIVDIQYIQNRSIII